MPAVVLLSGGLDSVISMLLAREQEEIILAITIDYGQRASANEIKASKNICQSLNIKHKVIELPFFKDLDIELTANHNNIINNPWVPNRNSLFINVAACYADSLEANSIIVGFNQEEAHTFPDNSLEFVEAINNSLYYATKNQVQVKSYISHLDKVGIIQVGNRLGLDFRTIWSCYYGGEKPCNSCSSCLRNKEAFVKAGVLYNEDFIY